MQDKTSRQDRQDRTEQGRTDTNTLRQRQRQTRSTPTPRGTGRRTSPVRWLTIPGKARCARQRYDRQAARNNSHNEPAHAPRSNPLEPGVATMSGNQSRPLTLRCELWQNRGIQAQGLQPNQGCNGPTLYGDSAQSLSVRSYEIPAGHLRFFMRLIQSCGPNKSAGPTRGRKLRLDRIKRRRWQ